MTSNFSNSFQRDYTDLLTKHGKTNANAALNQFNQTLNQVRKDDVFRVTHKREILEQRDTLIKWDPTKIHGREFSEYGVDQFKLHKKSLLPLDAKYF